MTPARTIPSSRLRTPAKPTAPVVPSPLRNAWSDGSPTSSREETKSSPGQTSAVKQTQTANFMAELIKETKPPSKPDLSNPYQTASPIAKIGPPRRSKRNRTTGKPSPLTVESKSEEQSKKDEGKKLTDYSPQAIIEATVPKVSLLLIVLYFPTNMQSILIYFSTLREVSVLDRLPTSISPLLLQKRRLLML